MTKSSLLATLLQKKVIIPAILVLVLLAATGLVIKFSIDFKKITISPELFLDFEALRCIFNGDSLTTEISTPDNDSQFLTTDTINFEGSYTYGCSDNSEMKYAWFLDSSDEPFSSNEPSASLANLSTGDHKVKFIVSTDKISREAEVSFKVIAPPTVPPQAFDPIPPPTPPQNQQPNAIIIDPKEGSSFTASYNSKTGQDYTRVTFFGSGTDPEDGNLSEDSLKWYYTLNGIKNLIGTGNSIVRYALPVPPECGYHSYLIMLESTDSNEATGSSSINIQVYNGRTCPVILF